MQLLSDFDVSYVVIGGLAVQAHGHVRTTQDIDLVPCPEADNLTRLAEALDSLGARRAGRGDRLGADALARRLARDAIVPLDTDAGGVDVHLAPPAAAPYADLAARALLISVVGVTVSIAGRDDLIAMKRASGRPIDRGDVIALTRSANAG